MEEEVKWFIGGQGAPAESKKLPYVAPWKTFSKLPDDEKEKVFNSIRGALIAANLMENK